MKIHIAWFFGIVALFAVQSPCSASVSAVWVNSGEDKVTQDELRVSRGSQNPANSLWDGTQVTLFGVGNEVVNFNLIIESLAGASNVTVTLNSLAGPNGNSISSWSATGDQVFNFVNRNIELFYVRYLPIRGLSRISYDTYDERHVPQRLQRPWTGAGYGSGTWQDRPDHDKYYPEIAVPLELVPGFNIAANQNQSVWADIYIPKTAVPGLYQGNLAIREGAALVRTIPVRLSVRSFQLPDTPSARTMLYYSSSNVNHRYLGSTWIDPSSSAGATAKLLRDRHFQLAHRHRISLIGDDIGNDCTAVTDQPCPEWQARLDGTLFTPANDYDGPGRGVGNNVYSIGTYGSWNWQSGGSAAMYQHSDNWVNWFTKSAPSTDYFLYLIDESTNYTQTETWAEWILQNPGPGHQLRSMATIPLPTASANTPSLDIPTSTLGVGDPSAWQPVADRYTSDSRKRFYMYNGHRPASGSFATEDDGVALRELAWGQYKKHVNRWFFWESTYYNNYQGGMGETNVFRNAQTFGTQSSVDSVVGATGWNYANGDGVLLYPGTDRLYPADSYGVNGPLASLRLKYWRRGVQDVDYLTMAATVNPSAVASLVATMVPKALWEYGVSDPNDPTWVRTAVSWTNNPETWEAARKQLADIIDGARAGTLVVTRPLTLSPASPSAGQMTTASFTVKNTATWPISVAYVLAGARDPSNNNVDFRVSPQFTLQPGEEYTYSAAKGFSSPGTYTVWPSLYDGTNWIELAPHTTFTVGGNASPAVVSVSPINGSGSPQTFNAVFSAPNGPADLFEVDLLINSSVNNTGACWIYYLPGSNALRLINDAGTSSVPGTINPGSAGSLSNSQCTVGNAGAVTISGTNLTLPVTITFSASFAGTKSVYGYASTNEGLNTGWKSLGTWARGSAAPTVVSVSPINRSGSPQTFSSTFSAPAGTADLFETDLFMNSSLNSTGACWVYYLPGSNTLRLINDAGTGSVPGYINPGSAGSLSNSQCTVANAGAVTLSGNNLTLPVAITFTSGFAGAKAVYGYASTNEGLNTGWNSMGTWTGH